MGGLSDMLKIDKPEGP